MATYPFFPFYPADWISSPRIMCSTLAEQGAYIRLLSVCWLSGTCSIPDDDKKIATLSGLPEQELTFVRSMFTKHPTIEHALTNERLLLEWVKAQRISDSRSQAGKKSGKSRRTSVHHLIEQNKNKNRTLVGISQSQSQSQSELIKEEEKKGSAEGNIPAVAVKPPKRKVLRSICDDDKPNDKHFAYGQRLGVDVGPQWGQFVNYCLAHDKRYADFNAAFRNWLTNAPKFQGGQRHAMR
ncbi:MAG: YdaU family protein [Nitrospira sp.]|nr:YdaU family protein [Nitrospira sp.]MDH5252223.1 YdaU family protein [Nitrospira sp.]